MHSSSIPRRALLACLALSSSALAQAIIPSLSFGYGEKISENGQDIPGWQLIGENQDPQMLSDRIILTPPAPGHTRGSLWADAANTQAQWEAEVVFRAGGQDRGSGDLQLWYVKDGKSAVGTNSVYTVPRFEGLVLIADQHGGRGGMLRGFLNDGNTEFRDHQMVDSLAFGHCDFFYRNQGRSSHITITHDGRGLDVKIDGEPCFSSDKVSLPADYGFGITATTGDDPDSFEVNSFTVKPSSGQGEALRSQPAGEQAGRSEGHINLPNAPEQLADQTAAELKQEEQFADLHNRLQGVSHQVNSIFDQLAKLAEQIDARQREIIEKIPASPQDTLVSLGKRLESVERIARQLQTDIEGRDYSEHLETLHEAVRDVKGGMADNLPDTIHEIVRSSATSITTYVLIVVAVQVALFGLYLLAKRRRGREKYL